MKIMRKVTDTEALFSPNLHCNNVSHAREKLQARHLWYTKIYIANKIKICEFLVENSFTNTTFALCMFMRVHFLPLIIRRCVLLIYVIAYIIFKISR